MPNADVEKWRRYFIYKGQVASGRDAVATNQPDQPEVPELPDDDDSRYWDTQFR
jgi:hypothetical protein